MKTKFHYGHFMACLVPHAQIFLKDSAKKIICLLFVLRVGFSGISQTTPLSFVQIPFSTTDLIAPGRGAEHWFSNAPWNNTTMVQIPAGNTKGLDYYIRLNWAQIETATQGVYDWSTFDMYINSAIDNGWKFNFGILTISEGYAPFGSPGGADLSYPTYLHNQMQAEAANSMDWVAGASNMWVPNWNSNNYLTALENLNNAIANHIATGSHSGKNYRDVIGYIDIRGFGHFGEWHNAPYDGATPAGRRATSATLRRIIDSHKNAFPNYPLVAIMNSFDPANSSQIPPDVTYYMLTTTNSWGQIGWRRDNWGQSLMDDILRDNPNGYNPGTGYVAFGPLINNKYKFAPVCGEPSTSPDMSPVTYADLPREIKEYHAMSFGNGNFGGGIGAQATKDSIIMASKWCGYRLVIEGGSITTNISSGCTPFSISLNWRNVGLAPTYENWNVVYELRNTSNVTVWSGTSSFNPKLFLPAPSATIVTDNFNLPSNIPAGNYNMVLVIRDPNGYRKPLPLAINGRAGDGSYLLKNITLAISTTNQLPVADAGQDISISISTGQANISGNSSYDPDGTITQFKWKKISGPAGGNLGSPSAAITTVTNLTTIGTYKFELTVVDDRCDSDKDTVTITVINGAVANIPPVTDAGQDITTSSSIANLDGSGTYDPDGSISTYKWTKIAGPFSFTISNPNIASPLITSLATGNYLFQLEATDNSGAKTKDTVIISSAATILPVQWLYFNAVHSGGHNELAWATTGEYQNDRFEIERSSDGKNYDRIGAVKGAGTSMQEQTYHFTDEQTVSGKTFYRLRQVNKDGKATYSIVVVVNGENVIQSIQYFPNPVQDHLTIVMNDRQQGLMRIGLYTLDGKLVKQQQLMKERDYISATVDVHALNKGVYLIKITVGNSLQETRKITKQ